MTGTSSTIRFGIIGCGSIAARHAAVLSAYGRLVAVCDVDANRAYGLGGKYGAAVYASAGAMLQEAGQLDVVVVCSPNGLHAAHSMAAMRHGAHVLCEKPMAISSADALAMMQVARETKRHLWVVKQNRFNPPVAAVKALLEAGRLGRILSVQCNAFWNRPPAYYAGSWRGTLELDGGTLYTQFSHFIDLLIWFFGPFEPACVLLDNLQHQGIIEFEDAGLVQGRFECGALLSIHYSVNAWQQNMEGSITILGERGTVKIGGQYLNALEYQSIEGQPIESLPAGNPANEYGQYRGSMSNHPQVYDALILQLDSEAAITPALQEAAGTVAVIEKIYRLGRQVPKD